MVRTGLTMSAVIVTVIAGLTLWAERAMPTDARAPMHYVFDGVVTRYRDKSEAVVAMWLMVGIAVGVSLWREPADGRDEQD